MAHNPRTDLAVEAHSAASGRSKEIPGVRSRERVENGISISEVVIEDERGARAVGKPVGKYVTIESRRLRRHDREHAAEVGHKLAAVLTSMYPPKPSNNVLVIGLGNWQATPDALGPNVVRRTLVTRHLKDSVGPELRGRLRAVAALAPGVLGITGVETGEVAHAMVQSTRPDFVIAVDALAARSVDRIASTVQVADTGIHPGSGVGNHRAGLTQETLGVPVIAIGVPTVVHAITIARDTLDALIAQLRGRVKLYELLDGMTDQDEDQLVAEVLGASMGDLMVTPKEIDAQIEDISRLIAGALNTSLHEGIDIGEFGLFS